MFLKTLKLSGFKSFAKPISLDFVGNISAIVGPNGSGKSNIVEAIAWVLGEQSLKSLRGKRSEDLIFNGAFSGRKHNRALVELVFLNGNTREEVSISRIVYRDGSNEYFLNNTRCRLKDIIEFLSKLGLGKSRHFIINQGEADKFLFSSARERREMIEDALGLRIYQIRKEEGLKKLEKTLQNIRQVESLRKEIQPHLRFLKRQVEKVEQVLEMKEELRKISLLYFRQLKKDFEKELRKLRELKKKPLDNLKNLKKEVGLLKKDLFQFNKISQDLLEARKEVNRLEREVGKYEALISHKELEIKKISSSEQQGMNFCFDSERLNNFFSFLQQELKRAISSNSLKLIKSILFQIEERLAKLLDPELAFNKNIKNKREGFRREKLSWEKELKKLKKEYEDLIESLRKAKESELLIQEKSERCREAERKIYEKELNISRLRNELRELELKEEKIRAEKSDLEEELFRIEVLIGKKIFWKENSEFKEIGKKEMGQLKNRIERLKVKIEEGDRISEELVKEYKEIKERDEFLSSQIADLKKTARSLRVLIKEMEEKLRSDFNFGIKKINREFQNFFEIMFGGGRAELKVVSSRKKIEGSFFSDSLEGKKNGEEDQNGVKDDEVKDGLEIKISLPRKKISSLNMLSGGERALVSIALLFAVSQVNPPPFLVLDETDAALDDSNSQKYAEMLRDLSQKTQLVLITHNRRTMESADILYGVTMDSDGVSRLLSLKLEEATEMID